MRIKKSDKQRIISLIALNFIMISIIIYLIFVVFHAYEWFDSNPMILYINILLIILCMIITITLFLKLIFIYGNNVKLWVSLIFTLVFLIIIYYSFAYYVLSINYNDSFKDNIKLSTIDSVYYSVTTFTTVGYGDISPFSSIAKMTAASEMICGYIVSTFIMAILVTKLIEKK